MLFRSTKLLRDIAKFHKEAAGYISKDALSTAIALLPTRNNMHDEWDTLDEVPRQATSHGADEDVEEYDDSEDEGPARRSGPRTARESDTDPKTRGQSPAVLAEEVLTVFNRSLSQFCPFIQLC